MTITPKLPRKLSKILKLLFFFVRIHNIPITPNVSIARWMNISMYKQKNVRPAMGLSIKPQKFVTRNNIFTQTWTLTQQKELLEYQPRFSNKTQPFKTNWNCITLQDCAQRINHILMERYVQIVPNNPSIILLCNVYRCNVQVLNSLFIIMWLINVNNVPKTRDMSKKLKSASQLFMLQIRMPCFSTSRRVMLPKLTSKMKFST